MKALVELAIAIAIAASIMSDTLAQSPPHEPTPGGRVVFSSAEQKKSWYDEWHFAPARVEGTLVFVSGVVAGSRDGKALDVAGFEAALRRAFASIEATLKAAGSSAREIVDMTSYHVFATPAFAGSKREHIDAVRRVKDEFVPAPYPTWTGIGVADLFPDNALVEIRVIARLATPKQEPSR